MPMPLKTKTNTMKVRDQLIQTLIIKSEKLCKKERSIVLKKIGFEGDSTEGDSRKPKV